MSLINNVKWVSFSQVTKIASQVIGLLVFSRFLTPKELGVMSLTLIVVNFVNILRDMGSSAALIQRENLDESLKNSVFVLNSILGLFLCMATFILSTQISIFFNEPMLISTLKLISIAFIINSVTSSHLALLERDSKFEKVAIVEVFSSLFSLFISVACVVYGFGVYSLVIQTLLYSMVSAVGFWLYSGWRPRILFKLADIKSIFMFSSNLVAFNFLNYFSRNCDQIIIGKYFSSSILGQYSLAYRLMLFPIQNITFVLTRSLYPILSRCQSNDSESFKIYLQTIKAISIIIPPLMLGLASVSQDFVKIFLGEKWFMVSDLLIWLAPVSIMQSMVSTTGSVFMSRARTNILFYISIYNAILQIGAFIIGGFYDIETLVKLYLLANILMFFPNLYLAVHTLNGNFFVFLKMIVKPIFFSIGMVCAIRVLSLSIVYLSIPVLVAFSLKVILGCIVYFIFLLIWERDFVYKVLKI